MNPNDHKKLTFWGASPIIFILTIVYAIPIIIINHFSEPGFEIGFIPYKIIRILAVGLLCLGIPLYISTIRILKSAYKKQKLITRGIFSISRNPLFAVVIFLILPGILLFFNSWLLLTIPVFMVIMFKVFIKREEKLMEKAFGQDYIDYKRDTSVLFPEIWKYKKSDS